MNKDIINKISDVIVEDYFKGDSLRKAIDKGVKMMEALDEESHREEYHQGVS